MVSVCRFEHFPGPRFLGTPTWPNTHPYSSISLCREACHAFQATARTPGLRLEGVGSCRGALRLEIPSFSCFWEEGKQSIILPYATVCTKGFLSGWHLCGPASVLAADTMGAARWAPGHCIMHLGTMVARGPIVWWRFVPSTQLFDNAPTIRQCPNYLTIP